LRAASAADVRPRPDSGPRVGGVPRSSFTKSLVQEVEEVSRPLSYPRRSQHMDHPRDSQRFSIKAAAAAAAGEHVQTSISSVARRADYVPGSGTWGFQVNLPSEKEALENARRRSPLALSEGGVSTGARPASFPPPQAGSARTSWLNAGLGGDEDLLLRIQTAGTPRGNDSVATAFVVKRDEMHPTLTAGTRHRRAPSSTNARR